MHKNISKSMQRTYEIAKFTKLDPWRANPAWGKEQQD